MQDKLVIGRDANEQLSALHLRMANRHGIISGATGTGKTVTLQKLAELFSNAGVCVFTADVKGDLSGLAYPAQPNDKLKARIKSLAIKGYKPASNPVVFWDIYGKEGHPIRATVSDIGPLLLGRLLDLNNTQQDVLNAAFRIADEKNLILVDLKDLSKVLEWINNNAPSLRSKYGNLPSNSISTIQRSVLSLDDAGGTHLFGEPSLNLADFFKKTSDGLGTINILDATKLILDQRLYCVFLLWLLSDLFEQLPEVGDLDKPKLVFFFDEAHLLFNTAPKPLLEKIEQLVRLIRSKGVGVFFVTQSPIDIPESVLGQLGNRIQHALRSFTPKDQKSVKVAAQTFRKNPKLNTEEVITQLAIGEALVSFLDTHGAPHLVERVSVYPPVSRMGGISDEEKKKVIAQSPFHGLYDKTIDRTSAFETLTQEDVEEEEQQSRQPTIKTTTKPRGRPRQSVAEALLKSTARSVGTQVGRQIIRGILGSIFKK